MKEADEQHRRLEEKLLNAEREKQNMEDQNKQAMDSLNKQVVNFLFILFLAVHF